MVKRQNRVRPVGTNDPVSNAPRHPGGNGKNQKISGPDSFGWERRTSCTLPHSVGHTALQRACCKDL